MGASAVHAARELYRAPTYWKQIDGCEWSAYLHSGLHTGCMWCKSCWSPVRHAVTVDLVSVLYGLASKPLVVLLVPIFSTNHLLPVRPMKPSHWRKSFAQRNVPCMSRNGMLYEKEFLTERKQAENNHVCSYIVCKQDFACITRLIYLSKILLRP